MSKNKRPGAPFGAPSASSSPSSDAPSLQALDAALQSGSLLAPGESPDRMPLVLPVWHAGTCPQCSGTGLAAAGYSTERCGTCKGRRFVKVNVDELEELRPVEAPKGEKGA